MFKEKILLEGNMPERALFRLQKAGITLYHAKKVKKNQILFVVSKKDSEKVFAIYPNICYNISERSAYFSRKAGAVGVYKLFSALQKRVGVLIGAAIFLFVVLFADRLVLSVAVKGDPSYRKSVLDVLNEHGVRRFAVYRAGREDEICAKLLSLDGVTFASVKKDGTVLQVEIRSSAFSERRPTTGDMLAKHTGVMLSAAVLRGTLLKAIGDKIEAGEPLVGGYFLSEGGEKQTVYPIARVRIACTVEGIFKGETEKEALAAALLSADGEIVEQSAQKTDEGYFVRIVYEAIESVNFT